MVDNNPVNIIYLLKNNINNKVYVGQTWRTLKDRWQNGTGYKRCTHIDSAIKKYGAEAFYYEILDFAFTQPQADILEIYYVSYYDSANRKLGYNLRFGGSRGRQ